MTRSRYHVNGSDRTSRCIVTQPKQSGRLPHFALVNGIHPRAFRTVELRGEFGQIRERTYHPVLRRTMGVLLDLKGYLLGRHGWAPHLPGRDWKIRFASVEEVKGEADEVRILVCWQLPEQNSRKKADGASDWDQVTVADLRSSSALKCTRDTLLSGLRCLQCSLLRIYFMVRSLFKLRLW